MLCFEDERSGKSVGLRGRQPRGEREEGRSDWAGRSKRKDKNMVAMKKAGN